MSVGRMRWAVAAGLMGLLAASCTRGSVEPTARSTEPRFAGPAEAIEGPSDGTAFEPPVPGIYRYSSAYLETGNDHTHSETLRVSDVPGSERAARSWWRQDTEMPWFESLLHQDDATRLTSFTLTEARETVCILEPPLIWIPRTLAPGKTWRGTSVCRNDSGFKRYLDVEMKVSGETQVTVGQESVPAMKIEGRLLITRASSVFTLGLERQVSPRHGLILTETWRFSDPYRGSGRLERTITGLTPT